MLIQVHFPSPSSTGAAVYTNKKYDCFLGQDWKGQEGACLALRTSLKGFVLVTVFPFLEF